MGNGNIELGIRTPPRGPGRSAVESLAETNGPSEPQPGKTTPPKQERPKICGAMTQQCGDFARGNQSSPQKLLQLVGCRDPNARPVPWVRPRPAPVKR